MKFGNGYEERPVLIIGTDTYNKLKEANFKDIEFEAIEDEYEWEIKTDEKYLCRCCGYNSLHEKPKGEYNICTICFWANDPIQFKEPNYEGGAGQALVECHKSCDG